MAKKTKPIKPPPVTGKPTIGVSHDPTLPIPGPAKPLRCDQPAFPHGDKALSRGMHLRDYFAAKALAGILSCDQPAAAHRTTTCAEAARWAYHYADAMLEARK
jgi:hypothetical protein